MSEPDITITLSFKAAGIVAEAVMDYADSIETLVHSCVEDMAYVTGGVLYYHRKLAAWQE